MNELYLPKKHFIKLEPQPLFPHTDLSDDNTDMLKEILVNNNDSKSGLQAQGERLSKAQRYIHYVADLALKLSGIATRYDEDELAAFSHGFGTFEAINMIMKPTRMHNMEAARQAVHELFVDTSDGVELEHKELLLATREQREPLPVRRERPFVEAELAERRAKWMEERPNTYDVIVEVGTKHSESMRALQARAMGAAIAHQLEVGKLDEAA